MMCCNKSNMEGYLFLALLYLIGVTICRSQEASYTYMVQGRTTWTSTIQSCDKKGGSLLTDVEIEDYFLNKMTLTNLQFEDDWQELGSQEFWIKEYSYKSPWISAKGCFSELANTSTKTTTWTNTVGTCYQRCSHSDYFSTQGNSCICLTKKGFKALGEVNGAMCNVKCTGNMSERCGGANVYDVYQTADIHPNPKPSCQQAQECDCMGLECNNSTAVYFSDVCKNTYKSACPFGKGISVGQLGIWSKMTDICVSGNGRYPVTTLNKTDSSILCGSSAWIGIFRLSLVSKGTNNCAYCTFRGLPNHTYLTCNVTDCHSYRTSICRYREDNALTSNKFTTTVTYGILIGVLIGMLSCVVICMPIIICLKRRPSRQRYSGGTGESTQVYFTASGGPSASPVYEGLDVHDYVDPI